MTPPTSPTPPSAAAASAPALQLTEVSKVYEVGGTEIVALDHVDLTVEANEVVTLLGPSGSGKSTLLSIAGGLLSASSGRVVVGGQDITRASGRKLTAFRRKRVGFIFQAVNLVPFLTARENLLVVAQLARRRPAEAKRRADRLLEELGLGHRTGNLPAQLSGGERQRVAIGRALMNQPALILVDEPTSALDSDRGQQVMQLIVSEVKARGAAAVIVTHDARMTRFGDRILNMADGRIATVEPRPEWTTPHQDRSPSVGMAGFAGSAGSPQPHDPTARPAAQMAQAPSAWPADHPGQPPAQGRPPLPRRQRPAAAARPTQPDQPIPLHPAPPPPAASSPFDDHAPVPDEDFWRRGRAGSSDPAVPAASVPSDGLVPGMPPVTPSSPDEDFWRRGKTAAPDPPASAPFGDLVPGMPPVTPSVPERPPAGAPPVAPAASGAEEDFWRRGRAGSSTPAGEDFWQRPPGGSGEAPAAGTEGARRREDMPSPPLLRSRLRPPSPPVLRHTEPSPPRPATPPAGTGTTPGTEPLPRLHPSSPVTPSDPRRRPPPDPPEPGQQQRGPDPLPRLHPSPPARPADPAKRPTRLADVGIRMGDDLRPSRRPPRSSGRADQGGERGTPPPRPGRWEPGDGGEPPLEPLPPGDQNDEHDQDEHDAGGIWPRGRWLPEDGDDG